MKFYLKHVFVTLSLTLSSWAIAQTGPIVPSERELQEMQEQERYDARDKKEQSVVQKNYFSLGQAAKDGVNPMKEFVANNLPQAKGDDTAKQDLTGFEMLGFATGGLALLSALAFALVWLARRIKSRE